MKERRFHRILPIFCAALLLTLTLFACGKTPATKDPFADIDAAKYVTLGEYKGIAVEYEKETFTNAEVIKEGKGYFQDFGVPMGLRANKDKTVVEMGDAVEFDYEGDAHDVSEDTLANMKEEKRVLEIGSNSFIQGAEDEDSFEEQIVGKAIGEKFDVVITFPEDYSIELGGKTATFHCVVHRIGSTVLTNECVTALSTAMQQYGYNASFETGDDFLKGVKDSMVSGAQSNNRQLAFDTAMGNATFEDLPKSLIEYSVEQITSTVQSEAEQYQITNSDDYLEQRYGYTDGLEKYAQEQGELTCKQTLFLLAVGKDASLEVTEKELQDAIAGARAQNGIEDTVTDEEILEQSGGKAYVMQSMLGEKVRDFIFEHAKNANA